MPSIKITEVDKTTSGTTTAVSYAVVVPGYIEDADVFKNVCDENSIYEVDNIDSFIKNIGMVESDGYHYGNQIAYELIKLGYTVLFKSMGTKSSQKISETPNICKDTFWEPLKDKAVYNFRFIISGLRDCDVKASTEGDNDEGYSVVVYKYMNEVTKSRGDSIAIKDIPESVYNDSTLGRSEILTSIIKYTNGMTSTSDKYSTIIFPSVKFDLGLTSAESRAYGNNETLPGSFFYLDCFKKSLDNTYPEYFAIAGQTRGVASHVVKGTLINLGDSDCQILSPRSNGTTDTALKIAINPIIKLRNNYYLWGNRTGHALESDLVASHFLNIRQLCCTIKQTVYNACKEFTFEPNSDLLWVNFCSAIRPTLEQMKVAQGINDYALTKVTTDKKAVLKARIQIVPIEAVEDFEIELALVDNIDNSTANIAITEITDSE